MVDYLREARADELALARTLRARIAAAPRGDYRSGLQRYLRETQGHARRVGGRLDELGAGEGPLLAAGIRAEEERMLQWLRHEIVKLTDPFIREQLDVGWAQHEEVSVDEVQRAIQRAQDGHADRV